MTIYSEEANILMNYDDKRFGDFILSIIQIHIKQQKHLVNNWDINSVASSLCRTNCIAFPRRFSAAG